MGKTAVVLLLMLLLPLIHGAQIRGYTYDFYTLELLNNTVIEINTQPPQQVVAKNGFYALTVPAGTYVLEGRHYIKGEVAYFTQENLTVPETGIYELDLLLEPVGNSTYSIEVPEVPSDVENDRQFDSLLFIGGVGLVLLLIYYNKIKHVRFFEPRKLKIAERDEKIDGGLDRNKGSAAQPEIIIRKVEAHPESTDLSKDAAEVLDAIRKSEGRLQQKELRKMFKFSEAKMSNLLDELEERQLVKRIKRGRGNLIKLN